MTEAVRSTKEQASGTSVLGDLARSPAADRLKSEFQDYLSAQAQSLLAGFGQRLGRGTALLNELAEGDSSGLAKVATDAGRKISEGKSPMRTAVELGGGLLKDRVTDAFKSLGGGGKGRGSRSGTKATVIMECIDVGVPLRTAYDQWTQYQEFSSFTKGVKSAQSTDDTTSDWKAKVFLSNRSWKASTTEQVPDDRIAWTSEGAKGTTKGVVSFHELAPNLTRVVLVLEYYPQGLFERTGNIWRAQGRRARLDLKHFARYITLRGEATDGWRGEIRDGEVVQSHDDALAEEEERGDEELRDQAPEGAERGGDEDGAEPESHDEYEYEANAGYEEAVAEDGEDGEEPGGEPEDEYDDAYPEEDAEEAEYPEEAAYEEDEDEEAGAYADEGDEPADYEDEEAADEADRTDEADEAGETDQAAEDEIDETDETDETEPAGGTRPGRRSGGRGRSGR